MEQAPQGELDAGKQRDSGCVFPAGDGLVVAHVVSFVQAH
jgi:hypothetical protein